MRSSLPVRVALCLGTMLVGATARSLETPHPPVNPGLTESVETRLVQFEVRVFRKGAPVSGLHAADFDIELGGKPLESFTVDDMCGGALASPPGAQAAPATRPGHFIFYFDGPELTVDGRRRAVEVARLVAPALMARGHDLLILSNGGGMRADTNWTHDPAVVSAALDRVASDPGNGDFSRATAEEVHAEALLDQLTGAVREAEMERQRAMRAAEASEERKRAADARKNSAGGLLAVPNPNPPIRENEPDRDTTHARTDAQLRIDAALAQLLGGLGPLVQDDLSRIERDLERLRGAVRFLALHDSPKGVVYFADTLRRDPGGVIVQSVDSAAQTTRFLTDPRWRTRVSAWNADAALESVVRDASTYGVRFYAVEGRGLSMPSNWVRASQDTLASLALDTGGLSFLNGIAPARIAESVVADQSCWYLVSFAPSGWDADRTLRLDVWSKLKGLHVQTRSALVIPSRATLTQARLINAHFDDPTLQARPLSVSVYPVGGTTKRLQVLAQVRLPDGDVPQARDTAWDIGFDLVSRGQVVAHNSSRVTWRGSGQPPVYQTMLSLPAGPYEIVAVAHEDANDSIREGRVNGTWPSSSTGGVALSLPALAQPQAGGIVLDGEVKGSGVVVRSAGNPVDPRAPVAIVTAACVDGPEDLVLRAERRIVGQTEVSFAPMELRPDEGRCVQIRDLVAAGSFGAGRLTYFVRLLSNHAEIASQELAFDVAEVPAPSHEVTAPPAK